MKRRDIILLAFIVLGFFFLAYLSTIGGNWSAANAQTVPPTSTRTATPFDPNHPPEVPEADTLLLFGGGLGGLATWLGWQRNRINAPRG